VRRFALAIVIVAAAAVVTASAPAATITQRVPISLVAQGCGEEILITGTLLLTTTSTTNSNGGFLVAFHASPQGATGLGLTSGAVYRATGETRANTTVNAGSTTTFVNNFKLIGPGNTPNYLETDIIHMTVDANGNVTASVLYSSIKCGP